MLLMAALVRAAGRLAAVEIVAHRGASYDAPENTLAAEKLAWEQKADAVETDIRLSKDGKIVVIHDANYKRTGALDVSVVDLGFDDARKLDAGQWKGAHFAGEKFPTLDEQIELVPKGKRLFVEIKVGPEIVPALARSLAAMHTNEKTVTIVGFQYESLREVRRLLPNYPTQYLVGYREPRPAKTGAKNRPTLDEIIAQAKVANFTGLDLQKTWPLTADDAKKISDAGLELHVWTVDEVAVAQRWIELGAKSIATNRPAWLRERLKL